MAKHLTPINEITIHYTRPHISNLEKIRGTIDAVEKLREVIGDGKLDFKEYCWVLLLTSNNNLLGISEINSGRMLEVDVSIREVMQLALITNAVGIIVVHNHPNGDPTPSSADFEFNQKLEDIGEIMDIKLKDNIIITSEKHVSIKARMNQ